MRSRIMSGLMIVLLFVFTFSAVVAKGARITRTTPALVSIAKEGSTKEAAFHDAMRKLWEDHIQNDPDNREQERNCITSSHPSQSIGRPQIKTTDEDEQRDDIETRGQSLSARDLARELSVDCKAVRELARAGQC
jgi:hypothetical protein